MKRFVAIDLKLMKENELSFIKWVLLENIHFLSNNSQNSCYASKESLGKHLGVTRRQIFTIIEGLVKSGYLIKVGKNNLQVTDKWLNLASTDAKESRCEKSSHSVKKVHSEDEPTVKKLPNESVKKVHTKEEISIKNNIKKNIINNIPKKREKHPLSLSRQTKFTNDIYNIKRQGLLSKLVEKIGLREASKKVGQQSKMEGIGDIIDGVKHLNNATNAHNKAYQEFLEKNASNKDRHDELWNKLKYYEKIKGPNGAVRKGVDEVNEGAQDTHLGIFKTLFGF